MFHFITSFGYRWWQHIFGAEAAKVRRSTAHVFRPRLNITPNYKTQKSPDNFRFWGSTDKHQVGLKVESTQLLLQTRVPGQSYCSSPCLLVPEQQNRTKPNLCKTWGNKNQTIPTSNIRRIWVPTSPKKLEPKDFFGYPKQIGQFFSVCRANFAQALARSSKSLIIRGLEGVIFFTLKDDFFDQTRRRILRPNKNIGAQKRQHFSLGKPYFKPQKSALWIEKNCFFLCFFLWHDIFTSFFAKMSSFDEQLAKGAIKPDNCNFTNTSSCQRPRGCETSINSSQQNLSIYVETLCWDLIYIFEDHSFHIVVSSSTELPWLGEVPGRTWKRYRQFRYLTGKFREFTVEPFSLLVSWTTCKMMDSWTPFSESSTRLEPFFLSLSRLPVSHTARTCDRPTSTGFLIGDLFCHLW